MVLCRADVQKKIVIRARVVFTKDGQQVVEDIEIKQFP